MNRIDYSLSAECINYEEYLDSTANVVTHYIVNVVYNQQSYQLKKRYSEFSDLHIALKDQFHAFQAYKFPNKSMFNTHSQFTKERRRQGFDELVKICCTLKPLPKEVEVFLELDEEDCGAAVIPGGVLAGLSDVPKKSSTVAINNQFDVKDSVESNDASHVSNSSLPPAVQTRNVSTLSNTPSEVPSQTAGISERRRLSSAAENKLPKGMVDMATTEEALRVQKRDYFLQVLPSSACLAAGGYATLVAGNVIDISTTNSARMVLTVLFFAFSLNVFRTLFFEGSTSGMSRPHTD